MAAQKSSYNGFTLVEVIIALIVIGILVAMISISFLHNTIDLESQAVLLVSDIRYTQNLAMTKGERYRLVIAPLSSSYQIINNDDVAIVMPSGNSGVMLDKKISLSTTNLPKNLIIFDSKGIPYVDTSDTKLAEIATISLTAGNSTAMVSIYPETGWATISSKPE